MPKYEIQVEIPQAGTFTGTNSINSLNGSSSAQKEHSFVDEVEDDATAYFERNRIQQLKDERIYIQKKTFTKWCNSFLNRVRTEIVDLFIDLGDGVILIKLLEIISNEKLGKPNRGKLRVQKIENLNTSLEFLKRKRIQLENIGAEDILDQNERLILGLIWTIILRFQIDIISIPMDEESGERKHAKDALLLWCQRKIADYSNVKVDNFTSSWRNGLAFNALIHSHRPDLINYGALSAQDPIGNLNNAFDVAEKKLEIARLLDAEDVNAAHPDEKSIITYVSMYYHHFAKQKTEMTGARRVAKIVGNLIASDRLEEDFENLCRDLLQWIQQTICLLSNRRFPNSLKGIQDEMVRFKSYRTQEKPPKYKEKGELEALFFTIKTKRKAMGRSPYVPPQGLYMHDVESAWASLDHSENERQLALAAELRRQERLEQIARKFERKVELRDCWLKERSIVLQDFDFGRTVAQVEASLKKHQAIAADILPQESRIKSLSVMANELQAERYNACDSIKTRERGIVDKWNQLLSILESRRKALLSLNGLMQLLRDVDTLSAEIHAIENEFGNCDINKHLIGIESLLEKQEISEAQLSMQGDLLKNVTSQALIYIRDKGEQYDVLQRKLEEANVYYESVVDLCRQQRMMLYRARDLYRFMQDHEEEMSWLREKEDFCMLIRSNRDITATPQLHRLFKVLETEMQGHWKHSKAIIAAGEHLSASASALEDTKSRVKSLQSMWERLRQTVDAASRSLKEADQVHQYFQDANEAESWIREKMPLVKSHDCGRDEQASECLLLRHTRLVEEIQAYRSDMDRLDEVAAELAGTEFVGGASASVEEHMEEIIVPQIRMLYQFSSRDLSVKKDEVLALIEKTNPDWWRVLKHNGTEGYVPGNYCKITEGEVVKIAQRIRKPKLDPNESRNTIIQRQEAISSDYRKLCSLAQEIFATMENAIHYYSWRKKYIDLRSKVRKRLLSDMIKLYKFLHECDQFDCWANEIEPTLADNVIGDNVAAFRKKFDKIDTEINTNGVSQLKRINEISNDLMGEGHMHTETISERNRSVEKRWSNIRTMLQMKLKQIETAERVATFNEYCEDARSWMSDKFELLNHKVDGNDAKAILALQKRYQNLGKDLKPLEDKIRYLQELSNQVKKEHPEEAAKIDQMVKELTAMHAELQKNSATRIEEAEQSQGHQMFENALRNLEKWIEKTKLLLSDDTRPVDVASAEDLLKKHFELYDDIAGKKYEFEYIFDLGMRLLQKSPSLDDVKRQLASLDSVQRSLQAQWKEKERYLKELLDFQLLNTEAERIDAITRGHEAFLELRNLGDSVETTENLLKRHADFEAKLAAQDDRLKAFSKSADQIIHSGHRESALIDSRRKEVLCRRALVHTGATKRRAKLEASLVYQNLRQNFYEVQQWLSAKMKIANDAAYKDSATLDLKLLKNLAFEAELKANSPRYDQLIRDAEVLIEQQHYESVSIKQLLDNFRSDWSKLCDAACLKGSRLRQAANQKVLNMLISDAHLRLNEIETELHSTELGSDLRGVKDLIHKDNVLNNEMTIFEARVKEIADKAYEMVQDGHFNAEDIRKSTTHLQKRYESLKLPLHKRRAALEESLKWQKLAFDVDCELHWICEKKPIAASSETGRSLTEAKNMLKKHERLEVEMNSRFPDIQATSKRGIELINQGHYAQANIREKCDELMQAWKHLTDLMSQRGNLLEWALEEEQYMFDSAEVESWMIEKRPLLSSEEYGQDEDAAMKLLAKHKTLQTDMGTYKKWLEDLSAKCKEFNKSLRFNKQRFNDRQDTLEREFDVLLRAADERRHNLENIVLLYQYLRESHSLEAWINEQLQIATSEDYGKDYEHLKELQNRFEEFKQSVKTGSERFIHCEQAAGSLLRKNPPFSVDVLKRQEKLRSVWALLLDYIESRDQKLQGAEELHRYNRDVAENLEQMVELRAALPTELGKDIKQVHSLWLRHEAFKNQLVAMEEQIQVLLEEGLRLKENYPGENAQHIEEQQKALAESWHDIHDAALRRCDLLSRAYDLQRFYVNARDLIGWTDVVIADMQSEQSIHDLQGAEWLQQEHFTLQSEIDAREPELDMLKQSGQDMIAIDHYASADVAEKLRQVANAMDQVRNEWNMRNSWLTQVREWHAFQREAKQTLAAIGAKQSTLRCAEVGGSIEEVENQMKKLETFRKALSTLEDRVLTLQANAKLLINTRHMESGKIDQWIRQVDSSLVQLRAAIVAREALLTDALELASFNGEVSEMENWITEKQKKITFEAERQAELGNIEEKLKRLQKHQAMEAELAANETRIEKIRLKASELSSDPSFNESSVNKLSSEVLKRWDVLLKMSKDQSNALEEARDLLNFNQLVERIKKWVKEKELLVNAAATGRDMEHCHLLLEKLDGSKADASVDESSLVSANRLGDKLIAQGRSSQELVQRQLSEVNTEWESLQGKLVSYLKLLHAAMEVHAFNRDVDDTCDRIQQKLILVSNDDLGRDLSSVETLIRKQEAVERDMGVIHEKLKVHDVDAQALLSKNPPLKETVIESLRKLEESWQKLAESATARGNCLIASGELHRFFDAVRKAEGRSLDMLNQMIVHEISETVTHADSLAARHAEKHAEIDGRQREMAELRDWGAKLIAEQPEHKSDVQRILKRLQTFEHQLRQAWEAKNTALARGRKRKLFADHASGIEKWLSSKEAFLNQADMGESVEFVDILLKSHIDFEKIFRAQSDRIDVLRKEADELIEKDYDYCGEIEKRRDSVLARHALLKDSCGRRRELLTESRKLHEFIDSCGEILTWISANIQLAYDETFLDQINLKSKLQKHLVFDAELDANQGRIEAIVGVGEKMISDQHYASDRIALQIGEVQGGWKELRRKSALKKRRLCEANESYQLNRRLEDFERWLEKVESDLSSEDHGKDYDSVEMLIKKLRELDAVIETREEVLVDIVEKARDFTEQDCAAAHDSLQLARAVEKRYKDLKRPCQIRNNNLKDALVFYKWKSEAEEQNEWLNDKIRQVESVDYGDTLHTVQSLTKKHAHIEEEINARQSALLEVEKTGLQMLKSNHFASKEIKERVDDLSSLALSVKQHVAERSKKLADSLKSQQYYAEASEAEQWMRERLPLISSQDSGRDQRVADSYLRRLTTLETDLGNFRVEIIRLSKSADEMVKSNHFDATNLTAKQVKLENLYEELRTNCAKRRTQLVNASKYYDFARRTDDLYHWLNERLETAKQENYGRDMEECQKLIANFDQVVRELSSAGEKVAAIQRTQEDLLRSGHPFGASIKAKGTDLQHLWSLVNETASERQLALMGAIQVHKFDQDADETLGWLEDKEALQVAMESENLDKADLLTLKKLLTKHDEFMHGVLAVEKQVNDLCKEAERLISLYPDTREHLEVRRMEMEEQLKDVMTTSRKTLEKLEQMQNLQSYFQEHRDLITWIKKLQLSITSETLPNDVESCQALMTRHMDYKTEITGGQHPVDEFIRKGRSMIANQHVLSYEISSKIKQLVSSFDLLKEIWKDRMILYEENLDLHMWKRDANALDSWLIEKECMLNEEWRKVENVEDVDNKIRSFDDFLVTLDAQYEKLDTLKRLTLLEKAYSQQRIKETEKLRTDEEESGWRRETVKTFEKQNKLQDRRKERERRMTQEVSLLKSNASVVDEQYSSRTLPHPRRGTEPVSPPNIIVLERKRLHQECENLATPDHVAEKMPQTSMSLTPGEITHIPLERVRSVRRTPAFTTRRSNSLKRSKWEDYGSIDMYGYLDRKQDLQSGGKKATIRTWKRYYTILCGQLLCFFKDEQAFMENSAMSAPINILSAECRASPEYVKKKNAFRLKTQDGSEYLFSCSEEKLMFEWVMKVNFHASLVPSQQLLSFNMNDAACVESTLKSVDLMRRHTLEYRSSERAVDVPSYVMAFDTKSFLNEKDTAFVSEAQHSRSRASTLEIEGQSLLSKDQEVDGKDSECSISGSILNRSFVNGGKGDASTTEFISFVEQSQSSDVRNASPCDDTESVKKRRAFPFFKRISKHK